jgi:hypothetical protein
MPSQSGTVAICEDHEISPCTKTNSSLLSIDAYNFFEENVAINYLIKANKKLNQESL